DAVDGAADGRGERAGDSVGEGREKDRRLVRAFDGVPGDDCRRVDVLGELKVAAWRVVGDAALVSLAGAAEIMRKMGERADSSPWVGGDRRGGDDERRRRGRCERRSDGARSTPQPSDSSHVASAFLYVA